MNKIDEEHKLFEQWFLDDIEVSPHYAKTVIFAREEDGDWYVRKDVQDKWWGWCGGRGISLYD